MNNIIIPWPSDTSSDFKQMAATLDEIGMCIPSFLLTFISAHGTSKWATDFGEIEKWVYCILEQHYDKIGRRLQSKDFSRLEYYELTVAYDRLHDMASGDDVDFGDFIYATMTVLRTYYASIALPELQGISGPFYLEHVKLPGEYAMIYLTPQLGIQIYEHYEPQAFHAPITQFSLEA